MSSSGIEREKYLIPLDEIIKATENFKTAIGDGGYGVVYKGQLSERWKNRVAAIKRPKENSFKQKEDFEKELEMVSKFHHQNVIPFIGYCNEGDNMIMVYEYASNGCLDDLIRDPNKRRSLPWAQRLKICLGAATGLEYLHSGLGEHNRVIHRDVKSANILLDDKMEAKICDFGLSRSGPRNQPQTQFYTSVVGTKYYCDPVYNESGFLTKESDVYSLGVVMFEMLSGLLAYGRRSVGGGKPLTLINLVRQNLNVGLDKIIDCEMSDQINSLSVKTFVRVAYRCITYELEKRPTMDRIIKEIEKALEFQKNNGIDLREDIDSRWKGITECEDFFSSLTGVEENSDKDSQHDIDSWLTSIPVNEDTRNLIPQSPMKSDEEDILVSNWRKGNFIHAIQNSGSKEDLEYQRKRKRMQSNHESALRSRMRKRKHRDNLKDQINQIKKHNTQIVTNINVITQQLVLVVAENSSLRALIAELSQRIVSLNEIINSCMNNNNNNTSGLNGLFEFEQREFMNNPWNLM